MKNLLLLLVIVGAMVALTGCQSESVPQPTPEQAQNMESPTLDTAGAGGAGAAGGDTQTKASDK